MTYGIYRLYYKENPDKSYVGKSANIELRYKSHCTALARGKHPSKLLQEAYTGTPPEGEVLQILDYGPAMLGMRETHYMLEYDSVEHGYNMNYGYEISDIGAPDTYENNQIRKAFEMMVEKADETDICLATGVTPKMLEGIRQGKLFDWLYVEYPVEYCIYQRTKVTKYSKGNWNEVLKARAVWGHK